MRPHVLDMQAFGPFASRQVLDFGELGGRGFFLIHGPTGSGKTTILDAMCFALYGDTSGAERQARDMRSDHADPSLSTSVRFDFSVGDKTYRVLRSPLQDRPKLRGEGTTTDQPTATLWDRTNAGPHHEGDPLATKWGEVTERIEAILGFRSVQFRQVVMLPQGQFQKLLQAPSKDREEILQRLFRTERFREIQDTLKQRALAGARELEQSQTRRQIVLEQAAVESPDDLGDRIARLNEQIDEAAVALAQAEAAEQSALEALKGAEAIVEKLDERDNAKSTVAELTKQTPTVAAWRDELARARKAAGLETPLALRGQRLGDLDQRTSEHEAAAADRERAAGEHAEAARRLAAEAAREIERTRLADEVRRLVGLQKKAAPLAEAAQNLAAAEEALAKAVRKRETAAAKAESASSASERLAHEIDGLRRAGESVETLRRLVAEAVQRAAMRRDLQAALDKHEQARKALTRAEKAATQARGLFDRAVDSLAVAEKAWSAGRAAVLAEQLEPGAPCPVCGSTEHPHPAQAPHAPPSDTQVDALRTDVVRLRDAFDEAREAADAARTADLGLDTEAGALGKALGDCADWPVERCDDEAREAEEGLARVEAGLLALNETMRLHGEAVAASEQARAALARADAAVTAATSARDQTAAVLQERAREIPDELRDPAALADAVGRAESARDKAFSTLEQAQTNERTAKEKLHAATEAAEHAGKALTTAQQQADAAAGEFARRRAADGFDDDEAYAAARRPPAAIQQLDVNIADHDKASSVAADRLKRATKAARGLKRPRLDALRDDHQTKKALADSQRDGRVGLAKDREAAQKAVAVLADLEAQLGHLEADYGVVGRLSDVANGQSPANPLKLSFQRYMLGAYLDEVLAVASERLTRMTEGRYRLRRIESSRDRRSAAGLDLEVTDSYTGTARHVSTLSGGEGFQASLSLALGLADVVQRYEGGIRLDAVFVDEGFGSLDPENLAAAIDTLMGLQTGGRLVGIISHVGELRDQIDARLEVSAERTGSTARFVVP